MAVPSSVEGMRVKNHLKGWVPDMPSGGTEGVDSAARFVKSLQAVFVAASAQGDDARRIREEALAAVAEWADPPGAAAPDVDVSHLVRGVSAEDRVRLGEVLTVIAEWVRTPGEETGRRVDEAIARLQRELGPLIARDREAEEAAERERLRVSVRESIARRLRESGAIGPRAG